MSRLWDFYFLFPKITASLPYYHYCLTFRLFLPLLICCFPSFYFLSFMADLKVLTLIICFSFPIIPYFVPLFPPVNVLLSCSFATVRHVDIFPSEASHAWLPSIHMQMMRANYGSACGYVCVCKNTFKGTLCRGRFELASPAFPMELPVANKLGPQNDKS